MSLPKSWSIVGIEETLLPFENGQTLRQGWSPQCESFPTMTDDDWGVLKTTAIQDGEFLPEHNKQLPASLEPDPLLEVEEGDLILTCAGPRSRCGVICMVRKTRPRLMISGKMYRFRTEPRLAVGSFLESFLRSQETKKRIDELKTGINDSGLNLTLARFKTLQVPLPPLNEQRRIVAKIEELFSELDKGIENLKQARAQLTVYRQSLLKHAFEGHLTADWRAAHADRIKACPELSALAVEQSRSTAELPSGWYRVVVDDLGEIETGTTPPTADASLYGGSIPFFKPTDLEQGASVRNARTHLTTRGAEHARLLPPGTTLVTCIGATIGKTGLATVECATNQQINSVSPASWIEPRFVYYQVIGPRFQEAIKRNASSTTLPILNKSKFAGLPMVLCSPEEQREVVTILDAQFSVMDETESDIDANLQKAEALRQSILKKAFAGELVPQDPNDEPASELLARIRAERGTIPPARRTRRRVPAIAAPVPPR
jgi:type I restriction enzyme S subunit